MPVPAVTAGGSLTVSSGSMSATHAAMSGVPPTLNLILRLGSVMTAHSVTSLPVPAVVGTAIIGGMRERIGLWPHSYSTMLPSSTATTPMPFAVSIEMPPPIATRPSQPCALYSAAPASTSSTPGLARTLSNTTGSTSELRSASSATSSNPAALTPASVTSSGRRMPSRLASRPSSWTAPRRWTRRVGDWYVRSVYSSIRVLYKKRPPGGCPAADRTLLNRYLVVDAAQVDPLPAADDAGGDVDDDRDHVRTDEVVDRVHGRLEGSPVEVGAVERPLVEHEEQEDTR